MMEDMMALLGGQNNSKEDLEEMDETPN